MVPAVRVCGVQTLTWLTLLALVGLLILTLRLSQLQLLTCLLGLSLTEHVVGVVRLLGVAVEKLLILLILVWVIALRIQGLRTLRMHRLQGIGRRPVVDRQMVGIGHRTKVKNARNSLWFLKKTNHKT